MGGNDKETVETYTLNTAICQEKPCTVCYNTTMERFEIYMGEDAQYHWRLKATNNEIVCWSEGYASKQKAQQSVEWVKKNSFDAPVIEE